jgi:hypothetical protein
VRKDKLEKLINESFDPTEIERREQKIRDLESKLKVAQREATDYRQQLEWLDEIARPVVTKVKPAKSKGKTQAAALLTWSDWHVEEVVEPGTVRGLNKYNPDIAKARAHHLFDTSGRLIEITQQDLELDTVVIGLLGDFITNYLHEDSPEITAMLPTHATMFAQDLIASGIAHLLDRFPEKHFTILCHSGNHGRTTKRVHHANENGHSLEWMMYCNLAQLFANEENVEFDIGDGYFTNLDVLGVRTRWHHGHNISYGGGVGGITIPINKAIAQWDKAAQADFDVFGHFHQFSDGGKWFCNGSLIGYNAYAQSIKAEPEPPQQGFHIIDARRGRTYRMPVYVEKGGEVK